MIAVTLKNANVQKQMMVVLHIIVEDNYCAKETSYMNAITVVNVTIAGARIVWLAVECQYPWKFLKQINVDGV